MYVFIAILLNILIAFMTSRLAEGRGRNPANWFLYGILFGLFATAFLFLLPPIAAEEKPSRTRNIQDREAPPSNLSNNPFDDKEWFYLNDLGQQAGPVSFTVLRRLWNEGNLHSSTYVWAEGMEEWRKVEAIANMESSLGQRHTHVKV